jgi:AcrR family transcriptional regulator
MKRGRRAGNPETREAILAAARESFARHGYEATTMRAVAKAAGVDVALPSYYFGSKDQLFAAAVELPFSPAQLLAGLLADDPDPSELGERILRTLLTAWDAAGGGPLAALMRSSGTQETMLRGFIAKELLPLLRGALRDSDPETADLRATLIASHVSGLLLMRYVLAIEPVASAEHDEIVALMAPTLTRYISGG